VLRIVVLAVAILAAFTALVVPLACGLSWYNHLSRWHGANLILAILCGLIAGLFCAVFHVKHETLTILFTCRHSFLETCRAGLGEMGYDVQQKNANQLVSRPTFRALLLGGRITVVVGEHQGRITGPKVFVEMLRRRLRLASHVASIEQLRRDSRIRHGDRLLKRVQISFRVTPEDWHKVGDGVLRQLVNEGADVLCEVHLMAQSEEGIRESVVEGQLRDWLKQENLSAELHKDHVSWEEPATVY